MSRRHRAGQYGRTSAGVLPGQRGYGQKESERLAEETRQMEHKLLALRRTIVSISPLERVPFSSFSDLLFFFRAHLPCTHEYIQRKLTRAGAIEGHRAPCWRRVEVCGAGTRVAAELLLKRAKAAELQEKDGCKELEKHSPQRGVVGIARSGVLAPCDRVGALRVNF